MKLWISRNKKSTQVDIWSKQPAYYSESFNCWENGTLGKLDGFLEHKIFKMIFEFPPPDECQCFQIEFIHGTWQKAKGKGK
jgi:hypothetical protein